ncbi:MAG: hypothetical protein WCT11_03120 [Candidatus Magasanikbacteria bacterium]
MFCKKIIFLAIFIFACFFARPVLAIQIENLVTTPVAGDYVIGPGKTELSLDPGGSAAKNLIVTNRYGQDMSFKIEIEDFAGSRNPLEPLVLLGSEKGPYSLRDFLHPEIAEFTLQHGQRITIPIKIEIPRDAQPSGLYGAVIVTTRPATTTNAVGSEVVAGNITVISRLASLFFVRVNGEIKTSGQLQDFYASAKFYSDPQIPFKSLYENTGNIYLNPYGILTVYNSLGTKIEEQVVNPYFVMPGSVRQKDYLVERKFMFGFYKAVLQMNRGYQDVIDTKTVYFWILPWKVVTAIVAGFLILIGLLKLLHGWFKENFEIKRKDQE